MTQHQIKIAPAKGRPMLTWVGKRPLSSVTVFPAQLVEIFDPTGNAAQRSSDLWTDWPDKYPRGGLLFHGDNKEVVAHLLANGFRGKVKLIYIDPPFDSGADYVRRVHLRGTGTAPIEGEGYTLGEQVQYQDIWVNDNYLQFMYERLLLLKELLRDDGSICLHCDWHKGHHLRCLLDEVFGADHFRNEIIWRYSKYQMRGMSRFVNNHDVLYWYSKGDSWTYNVITERLRKPKRLKRKRWDREARKIVNIRDDQGRLIYDEYAEGKVDDVWSIDIIGATSSERTDYPTQKPEALLERIIQALTNPNDIVLDAFVGAGTAALVAQKLGRRWICCDINRGAIQTTTKRLQTLILEQIKTSEASDCRDQTQVDRPGLMQPAQLSFATYRVNDYDLQIQHNEAVDLICEHIGIQRTHSDHFFDGTLGRTLVKIIPFNHPLSPLDLDEIQRELEARPEEDRNITVVCLGMELAAQAWLDDWNRLRKGEGAGNRIEVIELRTDPRHGKFIEHKPASAKVEINRQDGQIVVKIEDFISPTIIERLSQQSGILQPQIFDWRAMVDCVMIDPAYNGEVFNVVLSDIPARKTDLVEGTYVLPAPNGPTTVAVKITDMLGEEVLVKQDLL